jgi:hypothetical protein
MFRAPCLVGKPALVRSTTPGGSVSILVIILIILLVLALLGYIGRSRRV